MLSPVRAAAWERDSNCRLGVTPALEVCLLMPPKADDSDPGSHEYDPRHLEVRDSTTPPSSGRCSKPLEGVGGTDVERRSKSGPTVVHLTGLTHAC